MENAQIMLGDNAQGLYMNIAGDPGIEDWPHARASLYSKASTLLPVFFSSPIIVQSGW